jgi:hypothetical protein
MHLQTFINSKQTFSIKIKYRTYILKFLSIQYCIYHKSSIYEIPLSSASYTVVNVSFGHKLGGFRGYLT